MSGEEDYESVSGGSDIQNSVPIIAERVEYLSTRLTPAQHRDYESVKKVVLEELRLPPLEYQKRFLGARKRKSETWKSFTTRLRSYLNFYVEARGVSTSEKLLDLFVADHLKTRLTEEALKYVKLREGASWFDASESAKLLQTFEGAAGNKDASAGANVTNGETPATKPSGDNPKGRRKPPQGPKTRFNQQSKGKPNACFECGAEGHLRPNCPRVRERQTAATNAPARTERLIARAWGSLNERNRALWKPRDKRASCPTRYQSRTVPAGQAIFSNVVEGTPVLCALTDKLTSRTDCLLSAEDWGVLQENRDLEQEATGKVAPPTKRDELVAALELNEADAPQETREQAEENANEAVTVQNIGVIFHDDQDFGEVEYVPRKIAAAELVAFCGRDTVNVWDATFKGGLGPLYRVHGTLTAVHCYQVVDAVLIFYGNLLFQQDLAPVHTTRLVPAHLQQCVIEQTAWGKPPMTPIISVRAFAVPLGALRRTRCQLEL
ncbi:hypothetical protein HPB48_002969 [Haemaphysalis longicornis]|uniref:CCHC-type domain-containing protein n=1 Tax=Haemaphysalis longicornis TaxID=44386 RepID=A0A9J6FDX4_HAELO|nr:hypothetical protein HPB48_002969 [Haemaphysalis longicornis]